VVNFTTVACVISSRLKLYKNYKNRLRLAKVVVKNKMPRFLMVHCVETVKMCQIILDYVNCREWRLSCVYRHLELSWTSCC